jgi:hypothetical protein
MCEQTTSANCSCRGWRCRRRRLRCFGARFGSRARPHRTKIRRCAPPPLPHRGGGGAAVVLWIARRVLLLPWMMMPSCYSYSEPWSRMVPPPLDCETWLLALHCTAHCQFIVIRPLEKQGSQAIRRVCRVAVISRSLSTWCSCYITFTVNGDCEHRKSTLTGSF